MTRERLNEILERFGHVGVAVVGDFFLDKYLVIDPALTEISRETGEEAYQVVTTRQSPGAGGTACNNLAALGVGKLYAVGLTGDDGVGLELRQGLGAAGASLHYLRRVHGRVTPTYLKPVELLPDGRERERNRLDVKNRQPVSAEAEALMVAGLWGVAERVNGMLIVDQVEERGCGGITDRVREELGLLSLARPEMAILVDSRARIGEFQGVRLKPNREEARRAVGATEAATDEDLGRALARRSGRHVFLTRGAEGMLVCTAERAVPVAAPEVQGPVDIVGAGDAAAAGLLLSLCAGATAVEAAVVANVVASITVEQLGTTGTATQEQVRERFGECRELYASL